MIQKLAFQKGEIYYQIQGSGPVLVLLHGFLETSFIWDGFVDLLEAEKAV